jgi:hypothetical protein
MPAQKEVKGAGDAVRHRAVDGVALLRPVERDDQDAVLAADQNVVTCGRRAGGLGHRAVRLPRSSLFV